MTPGGGGGRSTATVLFTDLVASTERWSRLTEGAADALRRTHDWLLGEAVLLHQGRVVKSLGDGIMATFAGAAAAVDAAVAIQRAFDRHNRSAPSDSRLDARLGISSGDISFEAEDCFGLPVVEASRLCHAAQGGQILVSPVVRLLVGGQSGYRFSGVGNLELKGLPGEVGAYEVDWAPEIGLSIPLPAGIERAAAFRFVGRRTELNRLTGAWKNAIIGRRALVLVAGEPGIGKTRLMAQLAHLVHPEGGVVLYGRCEEEPGLPYQPFAEALGRYVAACPPADLRDQLGPLGGEVARLVPGLPSRMPELAEPLRAEPETERYRLLEAVRDFLSGMARSAPVLLLLDDLHWAGKPTLLLLRHLMRSGEADRLLVVATYRETDVPRGSALAQTVADLRREPDVERMSLKGLDEGETTALIEAAAGHPLEPEDMAFARAVHSETDGNPFFVGELLRHLAETGAVIRREQRWITARPLGELGIPEGVREIVGRRLAQLPPSANEVLSLAAVIGREFDVGLLAAVGDVNRDAVLDSLEEAEEARLVAATSGRAEHYAFAHALVRSALYEDMPSTRRLRLHRRIGEILEARPDADTHVSELARHFSEAASLGEVVRAVDYARRAGDRAGAGLAFEEALDYYRHALDLLASSEGEADEALRCDLLISLGEAQRRAGDADHRRTLLEAARRAQGLGDAERLGRAALANHRAFFSLLNEVDDERVQVVEAALDALGPGDSATRARLLVTLASELVFATEPERRLQLATAGLDMARRLGDLPTLADALVRGYVPIFTSLDVGALRAHTAELGAVAEQLGDPALAFWAPTWGFMTAVMAGDLDVAEALIASSTRMADDVREPFLRFIATAGRSHLSRIQGRLEESEALAYEAFALNQASGQPDAFSFFGIQLFWLRYDQGRLGETLEFFSRAMRRPRRSPLPLAAYCLTLCELGRLEEARVFFDELAATGFALPFAWMFGATILAEVAFLLDDAERAGTLYEGLAPYAGLLATNGAATTGPIDHYLGLLAATEGRLEAARAHFEEAMRTEERLPAPVWLARSQLECARVLVRQGRPEDAGRAAAMLEQSLGTARALGLGAIERRVEALIAG